LLTQHAPQEKEQELEPEPKKPGQVQEKEQKVVL
jgi:hypothetical protein